MRLSWNEVRARAATFASNWQDAKYEKGETHSFYNAFFDVFGVQRRNVARFEERVAKIDNRAGYIDLFWPGVLLVEQKSAGRDLLSAYAQAGEYFDALPDHDRPRYILVSDFQNFELHDLDEQQTVTFPLADFPTYVESFGFILGIQRRTFRDHDPANIKAAELVGKLYDALADAGHQSHDLERFLVRIVFCMFADDTGVFEARDVFLDFIETRTTADGADLGLWLAQLFDVLNTPKNQRPTTLDEDLNRFPYVDGDLFEERLTIFSFNAHLRDALLNACRFDWAAISPAIFGALFQSVMSPVERRVQGAHYTSEKNILKVIEPLFMDDLRAEFSRLRARQRNRSRLTALRNFQKKLGNLTFFDPACGCGNFLIIAYRELRSLEIEVINEIRDATAKMTQTVLDAAWSSLVDVDQFYGIEIGEFAVRIAETALWMMDHIMNSRLSLELGQSYVRIPLEKSPHIVHADALEVDWKVLLPPQKCSFILGNPPFSGFVMRAEDKQKQAKCLMKQLGARGVRLDYVAAWFLKAGNYFHRKRARIAFVATNSITQGEQVAQLWPALFDRYALEIAFAHQAFTWESDARGMAQVHVVILGLYDRKSSPSVKRLFAYEEHSDVAQEVKVSAISPYLFDAAPLHNIHLVVQRRNTPLAKFPPIMVGTKPVDGGHYLFTTTEKDSFIEQEPGAANLMRPFIGGHEYINSQPRWILHVAGEPASRLRALPKVVERINAVKQYRIKEAGNLGASLAEQPANYHVTVIPEQSFLVIPEVSSQHRRYVPIGWLAPPIIPSNKLLVVEDAELWQFALLTSAMHMAWLRYIGGRLGSGYSYSGGLVYNTFPPPTENNNLSKLEPLAQAILDARAIHPAETLADLYDPNLMPRNLRKAHQTLDRAVDRLYRRSGFASERERIEHLFMLYEKHASPLVSITDTNSTRRKRKH